MAGRHLKEIFRAFQARDELAFRRAAMEIIDEEQAKHHNALARDLQKLLVAGGGLLGSGLTWQWVNVAHAHLDLSPAWRGKKPTAKDRAHYRQFADSLDEQQKFELAYALHKRA